MTEDELIRFHNGDTLHNIPVIRLPPPPPQKRQARTRVAILAIGSAALAGAALGALASTGGDSGSAPHAASSAPATTAAPSALPTPAPTVTVYQAQPAETRTVTPDARPYRYPYEGVETVHVVSAPPTGGDPGMDYCVTYTGFSEGGDLEAILMVNAPPYECEDFLFSTHPSDGNGVWEEEEMPTDCADTPGGRPAYVMFDIASGWYGGDAYTCLLTNDGA